MKRALLAALPLAPLPLAAQNRWAHPVARTPRQAFAPARFDPRLAGDLPL